MMIDMGGVYSRRVTVVYGGLHVAAFTTAARGEPIDAKCEAKAGDQSRPEHHTGTQCSGKLEQPLK